MTILFFFHGIIFSYLKGRVSAFLLDFSEYFRGTAKFWRVENVNIDFNDDRVVSIFPLHPKGSISVISDLRAFVVFLKLKYSQSLNRLSATVSRNFKLCYHDGNHTTKSGSPS